MIEKHKDCGLCNEPIFPDDTRITLERKDSDNDKDPENAIYHSSCMMDIVNRKNKNVLKASSLMNGKYTKEKIKYTSVALPNSHSNNRLRSITDYE